MREEQTSTKALEGPLSGGNGTDDGGGKTTSKEAQFHADSTFSIQTHPVFEQILRSEEAAALLSIHPKTLQRLARKGQIPGFRIGRVWGFRTSVLNQWLESKMVS